MTEVKVRLGGMDVVYKDDDPDNDIQFILLCDDADDDYEHYMYVNRDDLFDFLTHLPPHKPRDKKG
jgi:hypothetical protein